VDVIPLLAFGNVVDRNALVSYWTSETGLPFDASKYGIGVQSLSIYLSFSFSIFHLNTVLITHDISFVSPICDISS